MLGRWLPFMKSSTMILRTKKIFRDSDTISFMVSLSDVDVRKQMKAGFELMAVTGRQFALNTPWSEQDVTTYLSNTLFIQYPSKYKTEMAAWAFRLCIRKGFIYPSATAENTYFLADLLSHKVGRPANEDEA